MPDDLAVRDALHAAGFDAECVSWSDASVDWRRFQLVVLRSTWDYHLRLAEFDEWLDALERVGVAVANPIPVLRWNSRKRYLRDLDARGVRVAPTIWIDEKVDGDASAVDREIASRGWTEIVIKPQVSASAHETWRAGAPLDREALARLARMRDSGGVMVQPFVDSIATVGERSLCFIAGEFSHAALRRPTRGDFRVQEEFGGSVEPTRVEPALIETARRALAAVPGETLYARVDLVETSDGPTLMELELVEPSLFLTTVPGGAERFARAIGDFAISDCARSSTS